MAEFENIKLICMDMDGTLLANGEIPELNLRALRLCDEKGIKLALVSGRNYRFLMPHAAQISPNVSIVSANGARIDINPGMNCIYEGVFEPDYAKMVCNVLYRVGVYFELYTECKNYIFKLERISKIHKHSLENYIKNKQILGVEYADSPSALDCEGIYKFVAFSDDNELMIDTKRALDEAHIVHSSSWWDNCEVMAPGVDKGSAVKRLCEYFNISQTDAMAFGDHTNDLSLLEAAGCPVAMQNGVDETKAIAKIIAPPNTEAGVGQVIMEKVLGITAK